jgi:molybdopterin molybdotransferase
MAPHAPDPLSALRRAAHRFGPGPPERTPAERALGRWLASTLSLPAGDRSAGPVRATVNGYALPAGCGPGEYFFEEGEVARRATGPPPAADAAPVLLRVETGDALPRGVDRVVAVEATVITAGSGSGPPRVSIAPGALPPAGHGLIASGEPLELAAGTRVDARLLALVLSREVAAVDTFPPEKVGILSIGGDLTDVAEARPGGGAQKDLTGFWLALAVEALGHMPVPLGIAGDGLEEGREALLRARKRKLRLLVASGGIGDGLGDRTVELLLRTGARIDLEGAAIRPGRRVLAALWEDLKILVLGGQPLDAAAAFDLFVRPALLRAIGAPAGVWDWSRRRHPASFLAVHSPPPAPAAETGAWTALAVAGESGGPGWTAFHGPLSPFLPGAPGQAGWAVIPPRGEAGNGSWPREFYFAPGAPEPARSSREEQRG